MDSPQSGDSDTDTHLSVVERRQFDPTTSDDLARLVVETVAATADNGAAETPAGPPLYESVDIDALFQVLFDTGQDPDNQLAHEQLSFEYRGFIVVVTGEGRIDVQTAT
ncbi:HalOD1 output domain-containing protein [Halobaculum limi]|uniref:HalOD1 output domain-containing protein n=1 Tax=Halobaculum limi TaxID=3031916 RepID=UPI002405D39A|nr:HalOD1 output domain-containing protein [Halobaculum sp. YSMS11]